MSTPASGRSPVAFRIRGVPVMLPWSSLAGVALVTWLFAPGFSVTGRATGSTYLVAAAFALLVYASILAHELAHAATAQHFGFDVGRIELHLLGGYTTYERGESSPGRELTIALAGPVTTLAVGVLAWVAARGATAALPDAYVLDDVLRRLALVSVFIGGYNLLPGLPLDGGALVKSLVWKLTGSEARGNVAGGVSGLVVAVVVFALPFVLTYSAGDGVGPDPVTVVLAAVFAAWLGTGALAAIRHGRLTSRLTSLSARSLLRPVLGVGGEVMLAQALESAGPDGPRLLVLDPAGRPVAVVQDAAVAAVPDHRRASVPVASVARTLESDVAIPVTLAGADLLHLLDVARASDHLVIDEGGRVVGLLTTAEVQAYLRG